MRPAPRHLRVRLMVALTFATGMLDAVGYLGLDRVFTGNMTGNVVILGMGLAGAGGLPVAGPLAALGGYVCGAAVVGRVLAGRPSTWNAAVTAVFTVNAGALVAAGIVLSVGHVTGSSIPGVLIAATLAVLMGAQASAARALAVPDMTTVVVTSTLTAYAGETLFAPGFGWFRHRRFWAIAAIFAGALSGALILERVHIAGPLFVAAGISAVVAVAGHFAWERAESA